MQHGDVGSSKRIFTEDRTMKSPLRKRISTPLVPVQWWLSGGSQVLHIYEGSHLTLPSLIMIFFTPIVGLFLLGESTESKENLMQLRDKLSQSKSTSLKRFQ